MAVFTGHCPHCSVCAAVAAAVLSCQVDDHLAELFLSEEPIEPAELKAAIRRATLTNKFVPVFMGSAYKNKGEDRMLSLTLMEKCMHIQLQHSTAQHCTVLHSTSQHSPAQNTHPMLAHTCWLFAGVQALLDGVSDYLPCPTDVANTALDLDHGEQALTLPCRSELSQTCLEQLLLKVSGSDLQQSCLTALRFKRSAANLHMSNGSYQVALC